MPGAEVGGLETLKKLMVRFLGILTVEKLGLEDSLYSTHSMRRTKPYLIYKKTKNLRVIQLLLGHKKLESTVRYLGIEVDDTLETSESIEV